MHSDDALNEGACHRAVPSPKRAVQFMPFAALKGYYELVGQKEDSIADEIVRSEWLSLSPEQDICDWEGAFQDVCDWEGDFQDI